MRKSGILMPVASLPGPYGIGSLGKPAFAFIDFLKKAGQKVWQMLPLSPTGFGDSPYQSCSAFAGNPYFIDLDILRKKGLLKKGEYGAKECCTNEGAVDYAALYHSRYGILRKAFARFSTWYPDDYYRFCYEQGWWLEDYALYMTAKGLYEGKSYLEWPEPVRSHTPEAIRQLYAEHEAEVHFWKFCQYEFSLQWTALKAYAGENGIEIMGDIPIYVAADSADVWAAPELFLLDACGAPKEVAGCPPDAFSDAGQLWGNPLYDWAHHEKTGFAWWVRRIRYALNFYDILRIDHFRGFDTYYAIPYGAKTAQTGEWRSGPGMKLFRAVKQALGDVPIVAEDLGELFPSVYELLAESGFPGMKVLQFAFGPGDSEYLPHNHVKNGVVYPGTHDNTTLTDWWENGASEKEKATAAAYLHLTPCKPTAKEVAAVKTAAARTALLRAALGSVADRAIIPMYDWLGLGAEAHLNTPGKLGGNWAWRAKAGFDSKALAAQIKAECAVYCRCNADVQNVKESAI